VRDMRDLKLEALSTLANIAVVEDARGSVTVTLGGSVIASGSNAYRIQLASAPNATVSGTSFDQLRVITEWGGTPVDLTAGEAGGTLKTYNSTLPDYLGSLDQLAVGLITEVNRSHASGYGVQVPPQTGINFFMGTDAASIGIDLTDTSGGALPGSAPVIDNIAASSVAGETGNTDVALLIANAFERRPLTDPSGAVLLGGSSIEQFYQNLITGLGSDVESAGMVTEVQDQVMSQLTQQREAISGVSLDEEMTNMIKYQRAFEAAARVVNVANDMFETILGMV
jgi:flagellar hook-associated protein 1